MAAGPRPGTPGRSSAARRAPAWVHVGEGEQQAGPAAVVVRCRPGLDRPDGPGTVPESPDGVPGG